MLWWYHRTSAGTTHNITCLNHARRRFMCLDKNDGLFVLTKMTGRVSWRKHLHVRCGLSLYSAEVGFFFLSRGGLQPQRKIESIRPFQQRHQFAFFFPCLPSFHCFRIKEYRSIENSRSLEVCVYRTQGILWFFPIMCVSVFSASSVSFSISFLSFFLMQFELPFLQVTETE